MKDLPSAQVIARLDACEQAIKEVGIALRQLIEATNRTTEILKTFLEQAGAVVEMDESTPGVDVEPGFVSEEIPQGESENEKSDPGQGPEVKDSTA